MTDIKGLLSIIVPVYNVEPYLANCLDSLLGQEYSNIEIILINDGSKDGSLAICQEYAKQDRRIKCFSQANQGQSVARNLALEQARGQYITFMDSDDEILPTTYLKAIELLNKHLECDQVQFPLHKRVGTPNPLIIVDKREPIYGVEAMLHNWVVNRDISWIVCNKIFRREAIGGLRFKSGYVYEDNLYVAQQLKQSKGICFSSEGAYLYYYRGGSTTNTFTEKNMHDMITIHIDIYNELKEFPSLSTARGYMAYSVACDVFATPKWQKVLSSVVKTGLAFLRQVPISEFMTARGLELRRKLKTLGIKLFAHFASLRK